MTTRSYTVVLIPDAEEGGYTVRVPALPGLTTEGDTLDEALEMACDAIRLHIEDLEADGEPIPEEGLPIRTAVVEVAA
jgi:predicted RNase H-like HicB family nuclease